MRRKIWPFYRDWGIIFGKDHAIGNNTKEVVGAVDKLFARDKRKCPFSPSTVASIPANTPPASDNDSDVRSGCRGEIVSSPTIIFLHMQLLQITTSLSKMLSRYI